MKSKIIAYFKSHTKMMLKAVASAIPKFLSNCGDEMKSYLNDKLQKTPEYENIENVIKCIALGIELKRCTTCGRLMKFSQLRSNFCSNECVGRNEEVIDRKKSTSIKKFGSLDEMHKMSKEHSIQTCLKKYRLIIY